MADWKAKSSMTGKNCNEQKTLMKEAQVKTRQMALQIVVGSGTTSDARLRDARGLQCSVIQAMAESLGLSSAYVQ